eukprot:4063914-Pleurochrysis_carterae.AAC.2
MQAPSSPGARRWRCGRRQADSRRSKRKPAQAYEAELGADPRDQDRWAYLNSELQPRVRICMQT